MNRTKGTGTITKTASRINPYRASVQINGKRLSVGSFPTRQAAEQALIRFTARPNDNPGITLGEIFTRWREGKFHKISQSTQCGYSAAWDKINALAGLKLREIRTADMQHELDNAEGGESSKSKIKVLLVMLFDWAIKNDYADKNYAKFLEVEKENHPEKQIIGDIQRKKLDQMAAAGDELAQTVAILWNTGFRINEFLSITPDKVIKDGSGLPIAFVGGLKTTAGKNRVTPISKKIQPLVVAWLNKGGKYVFCNEKRQRYPVETYRRRFEKLMSDIGQPGLTPHSTRHTFCSLAAAAGIPQSVIMAIAGHADENTNNRYTHADAAVLQKWVDMIA